jgi:hypothetical protein
MKKDIETEVVFFINDREFSTGWNSPEAIPNTGEYIVFPQVKGECRVEKIVHVFRENEDEVLHRVEVHLVNNSMLQ